MSEIEELYENFPTILKEKLRNKEIEFPSNTKFDYEKNICLSSCKQRDN